MSKDFQSQIPFISIVAIVAIVAIVGLLQNGGGFNFSSDRSFSSQNILGQAIAQPDPEQNWFEINDTLTVNDWVYLYNFTVFDHTMNTDRVISDEWLYVEDFLINSTHRARFYKFETNWVFVYDDDIFSFRAYDNVNQEWRYFTKVQSENSYFYMPEDFIIPTIQSLPTVETDATEFTLTINNPSSDGFVTYTIVNNGNARLTGECSQSNSPCTVTVNKGEDVRLTTTEVADAEFMSWSHTICQGTSRTCQFSMTGDVSIGAIFGLDLPAYPDPPQII